MGVVYLLYKTAFWRLHEPPKESYRTVVEHWPLTGWLTGGIMAAVIYLAE